jgi:hypothetical protein
MANNPEVGQHDPDSNGKCDIGTDHKYLVFISG